MTRFLRIATYTACILQIIFVVSQLPEIGRTEDIWTAVLLLAVPLLAVAALTTGPDREEQRLKKEIARTRLEQELEQLRGDRGEDSP